MDRQLSGDFALSQLQWNRLYYRRRVDNKKLHSFTAYTFLKQRIVQIWVLICYAHTWYNFISFPLSEDCNVENSQKEPENMLSLLLEAKYRKSFPYTVYFVWLRCSSGRALLSLGARHLWDCSLSDTVRSVPLWLWASNLTFGPLSFFLLLSFSSLEAWLFLYLCTIRQRRIRGKSSCFFMYELLWAYAYLNYTSLFCSYERSLLDERNNCMRLLDSGWKFYRASHRINPTCQISREVFVWISANIHLGKKHVLEEILCVVDIGICKSKRFRIS